MLLVAWIFPLGEQDNESFLLQQVLEGGLGCSPGAVVILFTSGRNGTKYSWRLCIFRGQRTDWGPPSPPSLLQALGRCPRNAPLLQSLISPVLLVSSGPFTCFPPLTSVLPTSTFPLLPSFLTSPALALSFKSVPLFSHPPMPFCLLASPLVHWVGVPSHRLLVQQQPLQLLWLSWLPSFSFFHPSPEHLEVANLRKTPQQKGFWPTLLSKGGGEVLLGNFWRCCVSRDGAEAHGTALGNH